MSKKKPYRFFVEIDGLIFRTGSSKLTERESDEILVNIRKAQHRNGATIAHVQVRETAWRDA